MLTDVDAFLKQRPQKDAKAFKNIPLKELAILGMENVVAKTAKNPALHTKLVGLAGYRAHCEECRRIGLR